MFETVDLDEHKASILVASGGKPGIGSAAFKSKSSAEARKSMVQQYIIYHMTTIILARHFMHSFPFNNGDMNQLIHPSIHSFMHILNSYLHLYPCL